MAIKGPADFLGRVQAALERFAPLYALITVAVFIAWCYSVSGKIVFQFDELLEVFSATSPTYQGVISMLASGVDFNPPLSHLMIRASMSVLGQTELAARLPALLGFVLMLASVYYLLSKQLGRLYGLIGILILLCLPVRNYALQARPYGIVLGLTGLICVFYSQFSRSKYPALMLTGIAICSAALVATHYYALLVVLVLAAAELIKTVMEKRANLPLLLAITAPAAMVLWLLRTAILQQRSSLANYFSRGNILSFKHGFDDFDLDPLVLCVAVLLVVCVLCLTSKADALPRVSSRIGLSTMEMVWPVGLLLLPIFGAFVTQFVTHAYVPRYFVSASIGLVICACYSIRALSGTIFALRLILVFALSLGFAKAVFQLAPHQSESLPSYQDLAAGDGPLLFDSPANYAQAYYYFPKLRQQMWVIAEPKASLRYRQYDTDDKIMLALAAHGNAQTITLEDATQKWSEFRLVPRSADYIWALRCLMDASSEIGVRRPFGVSNFIFNVKVRPEAIPSIHACAN